MRTEGKVEIIRNIKRVENYLILNSSFTNNIGLYNGKAGISLLFFHLARYTKNRLYKSFANEIIGEIFEEIHIDTPIGFAEGLCGIGWSVEYMLENGFVKGDSDEILYDIDSKVMEYNLLRMPDKSIDKGVEGICYYIQSRITSKFRGSNIGPFNDEFVAEWKMASKDITFPTKDCILSNICRNARINYNTDASLWKLGLLDGCAGVLFKEINNLNKDHYEI